MRTDKLTTLAQEAIQNAQSQANLAGHGELTPLHLLLAVVEEKNGIASSILQRAGVDANRVRDAAERELRRMPKVQGANAAPGATFVQILTDAEREAQRLASVSRGEKFFVLQAVSVHEVQPAPATSRRL